MTEKHIRVLFLAALFAAAAALAIPRTSLAGPGDGLAVDVFRPSTSAASFFDLVLPTPKLHLEWTAGAVVHYAHHPVKREIVRRSTGEVIDVRFPIAMRLQADLIASLSLFEILEIGLGVPVVAYQRGEGATPGGDLQSAGLGDPRLELKARFLDYKGLEAGVGAVATAPVGNYISSGQDLLGTTGPTVEPRLLASYSVGPLVLGLNAGFLVRQRSTLGEYEQRHALTWDVGAAFDVKEFAEPGGLRIVVEAFGEAGINFDSLRETPMEALVGVKYRTRTDWVLEVGAGPGLGNAVGTPMFRALVGFAYDPTKRSCDAGEEDLDGYQDNDKCIDPDHDADGLLDGLDRCPNDAEDEDDYKDDDGCPDLDNDADGVPDKLDGCPLIAEDRNGYMDEDGCPEGGPGKPTVKITDSQLLLSSKVYFDFNKTTVAPISYGILDAVAEAMLNNPQIKVIRVEGHTDNEGTPEYNLELSKSRAKAVVDYLIGKSVPAERLTFEGYGFEKPKASNTSEEGRAINRRVEFTIVQKE
jgi:outer membrane protein OmpA-like peptidoglycan-associated protein